MNWKQKLISSSIWVSFGILSGRLIGFIRDAVLASEFGATADADVAVLLLTVPDFLVNILVGGGLSVALIPEFTRFGKGLRSQCLYLQSSLAIGLLFSILAAVLVFFSQELVTLVAPGFSPETSQKAADIMSIVLWLVPLTTLAGVSTAYLQGAGRFAVPAMGTLLFNTTVVAGLLLFIDNAQQLQMLALFIILGGLIRLGSQVMVLPKIPIGWRCWRWRMLKRTVIARYLHAILAGGLLLSLPIIARAIASLHGEGAIALFNYASRLVQFPLSVSVTVLSVGLFPLLSACFARNARECEPMIKASLAAVIIIAISILLPLGWFSDDVAKLIFGWGRMGEAQTKTIGHLLFIGLFSLPLQGVSSVIVAIFNAKKDTKAMIPINLFAIGFFVMAGLGNAGQLGLDGLMITMVLTYTLVLVIQIILLKRRHDIVVGTLLVDRLFVSTLFIMLMVGVALLWAGDLFKANVYINVAIAAVVFMILLAVGAKRMGMYRQFTKNQETLV